MCEAPPEIVRTHRAKSLITGLRCGVVGGTLDDSADAAFGEIDEYTLGSGEYWGDNEIRSHGLQQSLLGPLPKTVKRYILPVGADN